MSRIIMLLKLKTIINTIIVCTFMMVGCSGNKKETAPQTSAPPQQTTTTKTNDLGSNSNQEFENQQLNYEIKKLNSELNYLKEQVADLDIKSSLYADPFSIYNKEIILNNGSSIFCKVLSQDNSQIFVETLIGNLTIDRSSVVRIVENITVLEENESSNQVIEISQEEQQQILDDSDLLDRRKRQSSATVILLGEINESKDKSGNTILKGELKNIGSKRADLVRIDFILRKNFQGDIDELTAYVLGSEHVFKDTGIISNSSIEAGAIGEFKLIIPNSMGNFIGYTYNLDWDSYE